MKGFTFPLESVLSIRRHKEESLQWQLAESERALATETARLARLDCEIKSQAQRIARHQATGLLDVNRLMLENSCLEGLERKRTQQVVTVERIAQQVADARDAVIRASRDKKTIERVREVLLLSFTQETARAEQKSADEMATMRHILRHSSSPGTSAP